uniref:Uncharacterized protein n=1 Tax=uncultured bacterium Contig137 TaxID=1393421 RepID=W0FKI1_9BACT|nr:hypothetical protein [uncultured bacterium Contig137]
MWCRAFPLSFQDHKHPDKKRFHNLKYIEKVAEVSADALSGEARSGGSTKRTSTTDFTVAD